MPDINVHISISGPVSVADLKVILPLLGDYPQDAVSLTSEPTAKAKPATKPADKPKAEEPKEEPSGAAEGPSLDDCKAAMKTFLEANDRDALTELLGRFGIRNISALPTAQYDEFIAACAG